MKLHFYVLICYLVDGRNIIFIYETENVFQINDVMSIMRIILFHR